jgi:hypothetical protein
MKISPPAFPTWIVDDSMAHGMSLRDYFAAQALTSMLSPTQNITEKTPDVAAKLSYTFADAMMKVREE